MRDRGEHRRADRVDGLHAGEVDDDAAMVDTVFVTIQAIPGVRTTETHLVAPV